MICRFYKKLRHSKEGSFTPNMIYGMALWLIIIFICSNNKSLISLFNQYTNKNQVISSILLVSTWGICMIIPTGLNIVIKKINKDK